MWRDFEGGVMESSRTFYPAKERLRMINTPNIAEIRAFVSRSVALVARRPIVGAELAE